MSTTVYAVMKVTIEIPVRASQGAETLDELMRVSQREAEGILRNNLPDKFNVVGPITFDRAVVKADK